MRLQMDNRRRSSVGLVLLCRVHAQLHVQTGRDAPGVEDDVHRDTMASVVDYFGSVMAAGDQIRPKKVAVEIDRLRSYATHLPAQDTGDAQIQQYVLDVRRANKTLTWEGMGNLAAQTCQD